LLDYDADINAQDNNSKTVLQYAEERGHKATVQLLLDRGASTVTRDSDDGSTAKRVLVHTATDPVPSLESLRLVRK
jgi:ankyrin repeat protein